MIHDVLATAVLLFIVQDPIGNVPLFLSVLRGVQPERRRRIIVRESLIGLAFLVLFLAQGGRLLTLLQVSVSSLSLAGGIILFIIALSMIFKGAEELFKAAPSAEPLIVPLAIPFIAGPSALTTVMLVSARHPGRGLLPLAALILAWTAGTAILMASDTLYRVLGRKAIMACERLMGLLLALISVEMVVNGLRQLSILPA